MAAKSVDSKSAAKRSQLQNIEHRMLLDYEGLSEQSTIRVSTLRRLVRAGKGPKLILVGKHHRFAPKDVAEWIEDLRDATGV